MDNIRYSTFRFNSKSSLLKILCVLARLCEVTPLQPLRLDCFIINFPSHPYWPLSFIFSLFAGRTTEQEERRLYPMIATHSPTCPPQRHHTPSLLPLIHRQGNIHASPLHSVLRRCWRNVFIAFCEIISPCTHLGLPLLLP